jgi:hypothetical protein
MGQAVPVAEGRSFAFHTPVACSEYNSRFSGEGFLSGPTKRIAWGLYGRSILDGMDLELEGRDLN